MKQERSIETRNKLIKAGHAIFLKNGFNQATMTQVIQEAGVGYGTAYVYFKNKDDLFNVIIDEAVLNLQEVVLFKFEPTSKEEAIQLIRKQLHLVVETANKERNILRVTHEAIGSSPLVANNWKRFQDTFKQSILHDINYVQRVGLAHEHLNADIISEVWYVMNEKVMWDFVLQTNNHHIDEVVELLIYFYTNSLYK